MKKTIYFILSGLILILTTSCEKNDNEKGQSITGKILSDSGCKGSTIMKTTTNTPDTISAIEYIFDSSNDKLSLKHINAGFNCCPDELSCTVTLNGDTIIIQEFEKAALCHCNCLYDLDIEINGVARKKYQVEFIEPYADDLQKIAFTLDLTQIDSDTYSVVRKQYPWGASNNN